MQAPLPHPDLLAEVLAYCEARGVAKTRFGREAVNDRSLVSDLLSGRELRLSTIAAIRRYMATGEARPKRRAA